MEDLEFGDGDRNRGAGAPGSGISVPRGIFTRRNRTMQPRKRPVDDLLNAGEGNSDWLTSFKHNLPTFHRGMGASAFPKNCAHCFPASRKIVRDKFLSLGIRNCLNGRTSATTNNQEKSRTLSELHFVEPTDVVQDPRFVSLLQTQNNAADAPGIDEDKLRIEKLRALHFLEEFGAKPIRDKLRLISWIFGWLASKIFHRLFDAVCVHDGQLELLSSYHVIHPIIYVPVQRSHWDHFVLNWVLSEAKLKTPLMLARRSLLNDPLLGMSAKRSGALGCLNRRKKCDETYDISTGHDSVNAALELYLKKQLENATSLEISVESHRSRCGKPSSVFVGTEFIHMISNSVTKGHIEDAYIVPVSVTYEKLPEVEIIGKWSSQLQQAPAGFFTKYLSFVGRLWNLLCLKLGYVRVNFGHPISVREFQSSVMTEKRVKTLLERTAEDSYFWVTEGYCFPLSSSELNWDNDTDSVTSLSSVYADTDTMVAPNKPSTLISDILTIHIVYDAFVATPIMSTDMLAFLLLTRYRKTGATLEKVAWDFEDLMYLCRDKKLDVGFSIKSDFNKVIVRAAAILGSGLVIKEVRGRNDIVLKPALCSSSLVQLSYYSNRILPHFALESIIAVVLFALQGRSLTLLNNGVCTTRICVKEDDVIDKAKQLATLLKAEFLLHPPCQQLEEAIKITIDKMRDEYLITREAKKVIRDDEEDDWQRKVYHDDDDDDWQSTDDPYSSYKLEIRSIEEPAVYENLVNVKNLVIPYIEAYAEAFEILHELLPTGEVTGTEDDKPELEVRQKMLERLINSPSVSQEVAVPDTVKNFIVSLKSLRILSYYPHESNGNVMLMLTEEYADPLKLETARNNILWFCTF